MCGISVLCNGVTGLVPATVDLLATMVAVAVALLAPHPISSVCGYVCEYVCEYEREKVREVERK